MILIRFAISMFALTLLGLAISLSTAQSGQNERAEVPVLRLTIDGLRHTHQSAPISTTLISASSVNTPMVAFEPLASIRSAPAEGAPA